jgi:hypothetical protein
MTRSLNLRTLAASISIAVGLLFWALPEQWIELRLGLGPDGGNGLFELLLVAIPLSAGLAITLGARAPARRTSQS